MSTESFPLEPDFIHGESYQFRGIRTRFEGGYIQTRPGWKNPRRRWILNWVHATEDMTEKVKAFVRNRKGATAPFYFYRTTDTLPRPFVGPTMGQSSGGSLPQRTRYAKFSWADTGLETTASVRSSSLIVVANYLLNVTVPTFPQEVTFVNVYVSDDDSTFWLQDDTITTSGGTWIEPVGGFADDTSNPPATNNFLDRVLVYLVEDSLEVVKQFANYYQMRIIFEEVYETPAAGAVYLASGAAVLAAFVSAGLARGKLWGVGAASLAAVTADGMATVDEGADWYVDAVSGDNGNGGKSRGDAFETITYAHGQANAGDTICVMAGTYDEKVTVTKINLTFRGDVGVTGRPVISTTQDHAFYSYNTADGLTVKGFEISSTTLRGIYSHYNDDCTFEDNRIHHVPSEGISIRGDNITVKNNVIYFCGHEDSEGMGIFVVDCTNSLVEGNQSLYVHKNNIRLRRGGNGTICRNNVCGYGHAGLAVNGTEGGITVTNNYVYKCISGAPIKHSEGTDGWNVFSYNTVENCSDFDVAVGVNDPVAEYIDIKNNLFKNGGVRHVYIDEGTITGNLEIDPNMYWKIGARPDYHLETDPGTVLYSSVAAIKAGTTYEDNGEEYSAENVGNYGCSGVTQTEPVWTPIQAIVHDASHNVGTADNTLDWHRRNYWESGAGNNTNEWIIYDFGTSETVTRFATTAYFGGFYVKNFKLEVSNDASSWSTAHTGQVPNHNLPWFVEVDTPTAGRYIRYWMTDCWSTKFRVADVEFAEMV